MCFTQGNVLVVQTACALLMNRAVRINLAFATRRSAPDALALAERSLTANALEVTTAWRMLAAAMAEVDA